MVNRETFLIKHSEKMYEKKKLKKYYRQNMGTEFLKILLKKDIEIICIS